MTKRFSALLAVGSAMTALFLYAAPAQAQATRTWVSGVGDDVNPCSRTAPCKTFAGAISKTATHGEINCLDPAGFGTVTITKSITIDCKSTHGSLLNSNVNGVNIAFDNFPGTDTRKTVRLRGLAFNGADTGTAGIRITGNTATNTEVYLEDSIIDGNFGGSGRGVTDERGAGGKLFISNATIRNLGGNGIFVNSPLAGAAQPLQVSLNNVQIYNTQAAASFSWGSRAIISGSVFSGNAVAGVYVDTAAIATVSNSVLSHNQNGVWNAGGTIQLSNNDIVFNNTGLNGATDSYGNNRISGSITTPGTAPTAISPGLQ